MSQLPPRLTELIRRDLGAETVVLVHPDEDDAPDDGALSAALPRGFRIRVVLGDPSADRAALSRRLETIVKSFWDSLGETLHPPARPALSEALQRELRALVTATGAINAIVIDAMSTVTWGEAAADDAAPHVEQALAEVIPIDRAARRATPAIGAPPPTATEQAVASVRALPAMTSLSKGAAFAHHERDGAVPYVARSFATIYVVVLVFDAPFDELRAERELHARMETIERLVVALPPLDPTPGDDRKAMRARR